MRRKTASFRRAKQRQRKPHKQTLHNSLTPTTPTCESSTSSVRRPRIGGVPRRVQASNLHRNVRKRWISSDGMIQITALGLLTAFAVACPKSHRRGSRRDTSIRRYASCRRIGREGVFDGSMVRLPGLREDDSLSRSGLEQVGLEKIEIGGATADGVTQADLDHAPRLGRHPCAS